MTRGTTKTNDEMEKLISKVCNNFFLQLESKFNTKLDELTKTMSSIRDTLKSINSSIADNANNINNLQKQVDAIDQRSSRNCLQLGGVAEVDNEDLVSTVCEVFSTNLTVPCSPEDIDFSIRVGKDNDTDHPRTILVNFINNFKHSRQANIKVDPATLPTFLTSSQVFKVKDQDRVVLPCEVTNPGPYVLAWKKGIAVLSAGSVKVSPDPRVQLINGFNLEIREVGPQDAGDYVCQIGTLQPREITHTLEVLVPPQITYTSSNGRVEVKKGSSVVLECRAGGNPVPKITWSRKNNLLPGGDQTIITSVLSLDRVDRHHAGIYQCTASNGIGEDASKQIVLHVLYPPEISVENPIVHTAEGLEAHLVCIVHGENQPEVLWYRDTMQLDTTERRIMESRGSRHTLVIRKVHRTDFGNYTCVADNQLGKTRKSIQLTGKPKPATFKSSTTGNYRESYNISWEVESLSPIEEYQLLFRRMIEGFPGSDDGHPQPLHHQSQKKIGSVENRTYSAVGYSVGFGYTRSSKGHSDWRNVILPASRVSNNGVQSMSYMIRGLEPGQQYEAKVQARNKFGWSPVSKSFTFQTTDRDMALADIRHFYEKNEASTIEDFFGIGASSVSTNMKLSILIIKISLFINLILFS